MDNYDDKKRGVSNEEARKILQEHGLNVTQEQATRLLDFLYLFAVFSLNYTKQHKNEDS